MTKISILILIILVAAAHPKPKTGKPDQGSPKEQTTSGEQAPYYKKGDTVLVKVVSYPSHETDPNQHNNETKPEKSEETDWPLDIITGLLFLATCGLVLVTAWLANVAKKQWVTFNDHAKIFGEQATTLANLTKGMNKSIEDAWAREKRELRAYVFEGDHPKHPLVIVDVFHSSKGPGFELMFQNTGKTPAYDVQIWGEAVIDTYKNPSKVDTDALIRNSVKAINNGMLYAGKSVLGPGQWRGFAPGIKDSFTGTPPNPDWDSVKWVNRQIALYVYGVVIYRDAFDNWWQYRFRFMNANLTGETVFGKNLSINSCNEGNEEKPYREADFV